LISVLTTVFANAATPQKCVFVVLVTAMVLAPVLAILARSGQGPWRRVLADLRIAAPSLGLLMGGMNSFHMARTILKLPQDLTARQIAPGILEVSTLIVMGVLVGLVALALLVLVDGVSRRLWRLDGWHGRGSLKPDSVSH
jgi:hypothetical protein